MDHIATPPVFAGYASIIAVFLAIATVALGLRLWVRKTITCSIARDDYTLTLSHCTNIAAGVVWLQAHIYAARFTPYSPELSSYLSLPEIVALGLIFTSSALNKASISSFFLKIAHKPWQRWAILLPLWMYITFLVIALLVVLLRCGLPINGTRIITATDCPIPRNVFNTLGSVMACLNSLCDWAFAFVPLRMVIGASRMDVTSKMSAGILIVLAVSSSFISLGRVPFFARGDSFEPHTVYNTVHIFILSVVENAVGVAVISAATLKPLLGIVRNGSLARRPSMAPILPQHRKGRNAKGGPPVVRAQETVTQRTDSFDWQVLRGIGVLPNAGTTSAIHSVDGEGLEPEEDNPNLLRKPPRVVVRMTMMASIDEVMRSATDSASTLTANPVSKEPHESEDKRNSL